MTITIDAPPSLEAAITQEATRKGLSLSEYTLRALLERTAGKGNDISLLHKPPEIENLWLQGEAPGVFQTQDSLSGIPRLEDA